MSHAAKFRKRAVEFEQLKQFDKAIASYIRAIDEADSAGEDVDVALYNKVGDLTMRLGRIPDAVTYYERAVESYASVGLFNNAIALCNKILRSAPGRSTIYFTLGRICAKKGLRGDASRNFLEYASRMRSEDRTDEAMRALAEVTELMPELTEVRGMVEEYAARAGIVLRRRETPARVDALEATERSRDLVFLDVNFVLPEERPRARMQPESVAPRIAARNSLDAAMIFDPSAVDAEHDAHRASALDEEEPSAVALDVAARRVAPRPLVQSVIVVETKLDGIEQVDDTPYAAPAPGLVDGLTTVVPVLESDEVSAAQSVGGLDSVQHVNADELLVTESGEFDVSTHAAVVADVESLIADESFANVANGVGTVVAEQLDIEPVLELDQAIAEGAATAEAGTYIDDFVQLHTDDQALRLDPHDFILPGELPPLRIPDALLYRAAVGDAAVGVDAAERQVTPSTGATVDDSSSANDAGPIADVDSVPSLAETRDFATPPVPVAVAQAVAAAQARHALLAQAVSEAPYDWPLRHRFAEALLEVGEREAGISELENALEGFVGASNLLAAFEVADELVQVGTHRIRHHQKRVELAVRLGDPARLRMSYLDLADALVRVGEDARAHAVYARVLEMDPSDERARMALGAAAPPLPAQQVEDSYVDLASWLKEDDGSSTRMRMHEPTITGDEQADFDALLRHFKEGVARAIGEDDHDSHYDLGVAYKEMGLLDDAVAEFQKALRSKVHRLPAYEALGQCFVEQGRHQIAATVLSRALHEPGLDDSHRIGVLYLLAYSLEALQRTDDARSYFERVYATDNQFRDVAARLAALDLVAQ